MDLQKILIEKNDQAKALLDEFRKISVEKQTPDRNRLNEISKKAFPHEIEAMWNYYSKSDEICDLRHRNLVTSVGTRIEPVLLVIAAIAPKTIIFVHTSQTEIQADKIIDSSYLKNIYKDKIPVTIKAKIEAVDVPETYKTLSEKVTGAENNWVIDITGGKKVMGTALSSFGFWRRISVVYLESKEFSGVPEPFSEKLRRIPNPYDCFGDPLLEAAEKAFNSYQYVSAIDTLTRLRKTIRYADLDHKLEVAIEMIKCYAAWDKFEHSNPEESPNNFYDNFEKAVEKYFRFKYEFFKKIDIDCNTKFIRELKNRYSMGRVSLIDDFRLIDVYMNAQRKAEQSLYDDAVARLYRCMEMAATIMLKKLCPKFNPDKADWDVLRNTFIGSDLDKEYVEITKEDPDKVEGLPKIKKVGLAIQRNILGMIGNVICSRREEFRENLQNAESATKIWEIMSNNDSLGKRNRSILAHGSKPLAKEDFDSFNKCVTDVLKIIFKADLPKLTKNARFPKITLV